MIRLPLLPRQIDWVRAAGNYVELRAGGRTIVHRALDPRRGARACRARLRPNPSLHSRPPRPHRRVRPHDVVLHDGTQLKIGKRYRADLAT